MKKFKNLGYICVHNSGNVMKFVKGNNKFNVEIFRLPNKLLYTSIKKMS